MTTTLPIASLSEVKLLSIGVIQIKSLVLNQQEVYLAIVGENSLVVADLTLVKDLEEDINKSILIFHVGPSGVAVKSVLWHPASSLKTHLVALTEKTITIYDLAVSFVGPQYEISLDSFPQLKDQSVVSMSFGSRSDYLGTITLYLSTLKGNIYALSPFIYNQFPQKFTGDMLLTYLKEAEECIRLCDDNIPPSSAFNKIRASLLDYKAYTTYLENLYLSWNMSYSSGDREWNFEASHVADTQLIGPIAELGSECRLINAAAEFTPTVLATISNSAEKTVMISYLAQLCPLLYAFFPMDDTFVEPVKPEANISTPLQETYIKPRRGFGFTVVTAAHNNSKGLLNSQLENYHQELVLYNAQKQAVLFLSRTFNRMTILTQDVTNEKVGELNDWFFKLESNLLLMSSAAGRLYTCNLHDALSGLSEDEEKDFTVTYDSHPTNFRAFTRYSGRNTNLLSLLAVRENSTLAIQDFSPTFGRCVLHRSEPNYEQIARGDAGKYTDRAAKELSEYLEGLPNIPKVKVVDTESLKSLEAIFGSSALAIKNVQKLTRFVLALQSTLAIQHGELNLQQHGLQEVSQKDYSAYKKKTEHRIERIIERQAKVYERAVSLLNLTAGRYEEKRKTLNLPLSAAERAWFKELNTTAKKIGTNEEDTEGLELMVRNLTDQVSSFQIQKKTHESTSQTLETLRMEKTWQRLNGVLEYERKLLSETRDKLDQLFDVADDYNIGVPVEETKAVTI